MNKREGKGKGPPSRDLMVCFPRRAHLTLMPKPVSSSPRRRPLHFHHHQNHLRKSMRGGGAGGGHASPYLKQISSDNLSEPTSPKVTCAGQIKVRPSTRSCKNWQTVMEEIERLHDSRKKKPTWVATLGFKREVMQFLTCLRRIKFDFSCLGGFSNVDITSDDDEDEESNNREESYNQDQDRHEDNDQEKESRTVFSKWFMVLQENQDCGVFEKDEKSLKPKEMEDPHCLPPTNALLLMRCRSAPAKTWQEDKQQEEDDHDHDDDDDKEEEEGEEEEEDHDHDKEEEEHVEDDDDEKKNEKKENKRKSLMELMKNEGDFYKLSCDIAKETWVIGGIHKDPFSRSRSWKR